MQLLWSRIRVPTTFILTLLVSFSLWAQIAPNGTYECALALSINPDIEAVTEDGDPLSVSQEAQETLFLEKAESFGQNISISDTDIDNVINEDIESFEAYRIGYKRILELFLNPQEVFRYMAKIETEFRKFDLANPDMSELEVLESVLTFYEQRNDVGFGEPLTLEDRTYSESDWFEMLRGGRPFLDTAFDQGNNEARSGHGYYTHRMQWMVVIFDYLEKGPDSYGGLRPVDLFTGMGKYTNGTNNGDNLWFALFDSFDGNLKQPETFRPLHGYWPYMMGWY